MLPKTEPLPLIRPRRLRANEAIRALVRETILDPADFIFPLFITHERSARKEISSMPGQFQIGLDHLPAELDSIISAGIRGVILFGIPSFKDSRGTESLGEEGIIPQAVRLIKKHAPELYVITDVCLCEYTDHGHCGPVLENGEVDNDATLELIARQAVVHARAGADMVAPSGMM
ncbi:MAG TPA: porphobilinogen synthase, partial [Bacteroidetes bacterium]|nr:porphobilinogen synthase [Bacteroidota bacterium]